MYITSTMYDTMYDKPCIVFKHMRIHLKRARFQYSFKIIIPSVKTHTGCPKDFEEVSSGCPEILAIIKKKIYGRRTSNYEFFFRFNHL